MLTVVRAKFVGENVHLINSHEKGLCPRQNRLYHALPINDTNLDIWQCLRAAERLGEAMFCS